MSRPTNARELAIALSKLEGDKYSRILPADYISYFRHGSRNTVKAAYEMNNKIISWVKQSILRYDDLEKRSEILKFFVYTAMVKKLKA
jgi:son of sevenless